MLGAHPLEPEVRQLDRARQVHAAVRRPREQPLEQDLRELVEDLGLGRHVRDYLGEEAVEADEPVERVAQLEPAIGVERHRTVV